MFCRSRTHWRSLAASGVVVALAMTVGCGVEGGGLAFCGAPSPTPTVRPFQRDNASDAALHAKVESALQDHGDIVGPDFAGAWIHTEDRSRISLAFTSQAAIDKALENPVLADLAKDSHITFVVQRFSQDDLEAGIGRVSKRLNSLLVGNERPGGAWPFQASVQSQEDVVNVRLDCSVASRRSEIEHALADDLRSGLVRLRFEKLGFQCTAIRRSGLGIVVRDAETGEQAGDGATVTIEDGDYRESYKRTLADFYRRLGSIRNFEAQPAAERRKALDLYFTFGGAPERTGSYRITVTKPGYETWARTVRVLKDECHVITQRVRVELERVS
jgi:hypothetical protein